MDVTICSETDWSRRGCAQLSTRAAAAAVCALPAQWGASLGTVISVQLIFLTASVRSKLQSSPKLLPDRLYTVKRHDPALLQLQRTAI